MATVAGACAGPPNSPTPHPSVLLPAGWTNAVSLGLPPTLSFFISVSPFYDSSEMWCCHRTFHLNVTPSEQTASLSFLLLTASSPGNPLVFLLRRAGVPTLLLLLMTIRFLE